MNKSEVFQSPSLLLLLPAGRGAVRGAASGASISAVAGGDAAVGGAVGATSRAMRANRYRHYSRW